MRGITNAPGMSVPDVLNYVSGEFHEFANNLSTYWSRLRKLELMAYNPKLGDIVHYAGFDWVVCHVDYDAMHYYMALKDIREEIAFSATDSTTFRNSDLENKLKEFDNLLIVFSMGRNLQGENGNCELEPVTFHSITYEGGSVYAPTIYAFIPSEQQITTDFDLFNDKKFGRRQAMFPGHTVDTTFNSSVFFVSTIGNFSVTHEVHSWWTCTPSGNSVKIVGPAGNTLGKYPSDLAGFRPFVCMRMREIPETADDESGGS